MGAYAYKYVRDYLPEFVKDDDYEGSADYDGDQWYAAEEYIKALEKEIVHQYGLTSKFNNFNLLEWLKHRPKTSYCDGPVI